MYGALIANFLIPSGMALHYSIGIFICIQVIFAIIVGIDRSWFG
jgi:hypothetical protein